MELEYPLDLNTFIELSLIQVKVLTLETVNHVTGFQQVITTGEMMNIYGNYYNNLVPPQNNTVYVPKFETISEI